MASISVDMSVFDLFCIGVGPSSSHTVGPMRAANRFANELIQLQKLADTNQVICDLYGSLALTGKGHWTDCAVLLGLSGETPEGVDPDVMLTTVQTIRDKKQLIIAGKQSVGFDEQRDMLFHYDEILAEHPNGVRFRAFSKSAEILYEQYYFSVGGGTVVSREELEESSDTEDERLSKLKFPYSFATELLEIGETESLSIAQIVLQNELYWRSEKEIVKGMLRIRDAMNACIDRGCHSTGYLPGGLNIKRRANTMFNKLQSTASHSDDPLIVMDWVSMYALAVNEENAAGGRVVTAPTNGAAGVIPAVLRYYETFCKGASDKGVIEFLLVSGAIGILYKKNASVSAAEMGCQGEIGSACSMAAGALTAALGGSNAQIENAAEIGMEHNLGLTCDPVGGLVQVPCIERNTMGAIKAINASRLALSDNGDHHKVSLDKVIETMRRTGMDMQTKYKETSLGGLAVSVVEC